MAAKFLPGDKIQYRREYLTQQPGLAGVFVVDALPATYAGSGPHSPKYGVQCGGCAPVSWGGSLWDWEHALEHATPAQAPALPARPHRFNVGDVVQATAATLTKQPQWRGQSWTVQKYLPDANCGNCGGACPSVVLGLVTAWECAVELVPATKSSAVPPVAALRPATARARHPKLACCGWCGDPLVQLYVPGRPGVRGCDVHGSECPVLEPGILQARRP